MEKHWPALCALILTLAALVHFDTAAASQADAASRGNVSSPPQQPSSLKFGCVPLGFTHTHFLFVCSFPSSDSYQTRLLPAGPQGCPSAHGLRV